MRLEAAARMDVFRKLWRARKLIVVVFIPLSLLPLPLVHPTSVSTAQYTTLLSKASKLVELFKIKACGLHIVAFLKIVA